MVTRVGLEAVQPNEGTKTITGAVIKNIPADKRFFILPPAMELLSPGRYPHARLFVKATGRLLSDLLHGRQWAEPLGLDCKNGVELAAEVLQSDDSRQLHQLFLAKLSLEAVEETIRDPLVCVSHPLAKL